MRIILDLEDKPEFVRIQTTEEDEFERERESLKAVLLGKEQAIAQFSMTLKLQDGQINELKAALSNA